MTPVRTLRLTAIAIVAMAVATSGCAEQPGTTGDAVEGAVSTTAPPPSTAQAPQTRAAVDSVAPPSSTTSSTSPTTTATTTPTVPQTTSTTAIARPTGIDPARIVIPAIAVDAAVVDLSLAGSEPEVPGEWADAGWYTTTRNPGEVGPAVIAGHIDSTSGPAVFFRLDELVTGDRIEVSSSDGQTRTFEVTSSGTYPKTDLPPEVFGFGHPVPELRLITCGGSFDASVGHYRDNHVVYAQAVAA